MQRTIYDNKLTKVLDTYLEPSQTSMMEIFCENSSRFRQKSAIIDT